MDAGRNFAVSAVDRENQACVDKHLNELRNEWRSQAKNKVFDLHKQVLLQSTDGDAYKNVVIDMILHGRAIFKDGKNIKQFLKKLIADHVSIHVKATSSCEFFIRRKCLLWSLGNGNQNPVCADDGMFNP